MPAFESRRVRTQPLTVTGASCGARPARISEQEREVMSYSLLSGTEINMTNLPSGIRSRRIPGINGLTMHVLEAGFETQNRPCLLLLHGFPELAYSWRKVMLPLAAAGFHVVAPDQRGYGRTTGWDGHCDGDVGSFPMLNLAPDALRLVHPVRYQSV